MEKDIPRHPLSDRRKVLAEIDFDNLRAGVPETPKRILEKRFDLGVEQVQVLPWGISESHALQIGPIRARRGCVFRDDLIDECAVFDSAARTPVVSSVWEIGATPSRDHRPVVGLKPTTPHSDAGTRIEPTVSPPNAAGTIRAATEAPDPLDEPPATCS